MGHCLKGVSTRLPWGASGRAGGKRVVLSLRTAASSGEMLTRMAEYSIVLLADRRDPENFLSCQSPCVHASRATSASPLRRYDHGEWADSHLELLSQVGLHVFWGTDAQPRRNHLSSSL